MRTRWLIAILLTMLAGGVALANNDARRTAAVYNHPSQRLMCSTWCDGTRPCSFTIKMYGPEGTTVLQKQFTGVQAKGARSLIYYGLANPVTCEIDVTAGLAKKPSWTVLDVAGKPMAMDTNED